MQKNIMAKIGMITGFLIILSILLLCISGVVSERERFKEKVSTDISKTWGKRQTIDLPKLIYEHSDKTLIKTAAKGRKISVETKDGDTITKYIYADSIDTNADVKGELKQKSIYKIPVYTAKIKQKGEFRIKNLKNTKAVLSFKVSDRKGFINKPKVRFNNKELTDCSSYQCNVYIKDEPVIPYEIEYELRGTEELSFMAGGTFHQTHLKTNWTTAEFTGDFSPVEHTNSKEGYTVFWSVPEAASALPLNGIEEYEENSKYTMNFINTVDNYRMTERCVKYGFLFIALTFLAFFIYEITNKTNKHIHPFQYSLVGVSMLVFYLLLLSMSEFISFGISYLIASLMTIALISSYTYFVLVKRGDKKFPLAVAGILALIYLYLYVTVNLEELSLLAGSFGLFITIIITMYATRNVEWYKE
ncbi:MAG: cell envelope integrity protein CreD [Candidatus Gastranaerophilales bacterium]|nr:cell envelope integrity protein CreD [Candidatus Gastranaerophilales bacterium]